MKDKVMKRKIILIGILIIVAFFSFNSLTFSSLNENKLFYKEKLKNECPYIQSLKSNDNTNCPYLNKKNSKVEERNDNHEECANSNRNNAKQEKCPYSDEKSEQKESINKSAIKNS